MKGQAIQLQTPLSESDVRNLRRGDVVEITGMIYTGRDAVHKYLHDGGESPVDLNGSIIYHCGPVMVQENGVWVVKAAGPTTSIREEPYQGDLIRKFNIRGVIGKGGMGKKTLDACREHGCVYLHAIGGAAQVLAERIVRVDKVDFLEKFGSPEAIWHLVADKFPAVVTMDAHGDSLHEEVEGISRQKLESLF
ncbi:MAG: fumarate hydratase C-terminal domain-containing protein [Candidatus Eisenbacteria bacterium]|uniref:Fumarate hydratase C-terminal domain-containing protein n=1 Tax=Eiseniibacteriota bacterium TaxID=2212470 RepID=A0A948RWN4_UNCEI|nr:fumarate hydratase C-terminal domain-containing protein [Candidatus Eisenbacteria bacterium]MBU1950974.1 fumarate hydratase C-terminal domain-containing protein [Candidatus Eisenbacteria bacterium]MBU2690917.1 fumarate hydratase C-terminal domain-containing protein [Candidatus Eisenbacteria bacterium]